MADKCLLRCAIHVAMGRLTTESKAGSMVIILDPDEIKEKLDELHVSSISATDIDGYLREAVVDDDLVFKGNADKSLYFLSQEGLEGLGIV